MSGQPSYRMWKRSWLAFSEPIFCSSLLRVVTRLNSCYRISLEQDKPELARVKDSIEKFKEQMKEDLSVVDENLKHVQDLKTEKRELKAKIVSDRSIS